LLGAAITLPMILVSGPIAGFVIGQFILVNYFGLPWILMPIFVVLGFIGSGIQTYRLVKRIKDIDSKR